MKARELAKWFLKTNPALRNGYNDENTKLNKLLYFSNLMYFSVKEENLIDEPFEKWDNGPVIRSIYSDYRYSGLSQTKDLTGEITDDFVLQILRIVNFIYGDMQASELSEESHKSTIWQEPKRNEKIEFSHIDPSEKQMMHNLYEAYEDFDFDHCGIEWINGNKYVYDTRNLEMTDELIQELEQITEKRDPAFIELVDGEMVFS